MGTFVWRILGHYVNSNYNNNLNANNANDEEERLGKIIRGEMLNVDEVDAIQICTIATATLSLFGSGFVLLSYFCLPPLRRAGMLNHIVCMLCLADFMSSVVCILEIALMDLDEVVCRVFGSLDLFCIVSTTFWTCSVAIEMAWIEHNGRRDSFGEIKYPKRSKFQYAYHLICWGGGLLAVIEPAMDDTFINSANSCWFEDLLAPFPVTIVSMIAGALVFCLMCYSYAIYCRYRLYNTSAFETVSDANSKRSIIRQVSGYVIVYLVTWCTLPILTVAHYFHIYENHRDLITLLMILAILVPLSGFLDAFVYAFDYETRRVLKKEILKLILTKQSLNQFMSFSRDNSGLVEQPFNPNVMYIAGVVPLRVSTRPGGGSLSKPQGLALDHPTGESSFEYVPDALTIDTEEEDIDIHDAGREGTTTSDPSLAWDAQHMHPGMSSFIGTSDTSRSDHSSYNRERTRPVPTFKDRYAYEY